MDEIEIVEKRICKNINELDLYRYDPRDIKEMQLKLNNLGSYARHILKGIESFFPIMLRKVFGIEKSIFPTTFTFLSESVFDARKNGFILPLKYTDEDLMEKCIQIYYEGDGLWKSEVFIDTYVIDTDRKPSMPLYTLCRCNQLLYKMGKYYANEEYRNISIQSARLLLKQYPIKTYEDGSMSIGYHYNTDDCTINVNTEVAEWLSMFEEMELECELESLLNGILYMTLREQNEDGSWFYTSKEDISRGIGSKGIDCHHTATVIRNLLHVLDSNRCDKNLKLKLLASIERGIRYFIDNFFSIENGWAITEIGLKLKACTMQYSEALYTFIDIINSKNFCNSDIKYESKILSRICVNNILKLVEEDGSAPGMRYFRPINIDSINWGNGAALWALEHYRCYAMIKNE